MGMGQDFKRHKNDWEPTICRIFLSNHPALRQLEFYHFPRHRRGEELRPQSFPFSNQVEKWLRLGWMRTGVAQKSFMVDHGSSGLIFPEMRFSWRYSLGTVPSQTVEWPEGSHPWKPSIYRFLMISPYIFHISIAKSMTVPRIFHSKSGIFGAWGIWHSHGSISLLSGDAQWGQATQMWPDSWLPSVTQLAACRFGETKRVVSASSKLVTLISGTDATCK